MIDLTGMKSVEHYSYCDFCETERVVDVPQTGLFGRSKQIYPEFEHICGDDPEWSIVWVVSSTLARA